MDDIADNYKNYLAIKSKVQMLLKISNKNLRTLAKTMAYKYSENLNEATDHAYRKRV